MSEHATCDTHAQVFSDSIKQSFVENKEEEVTDFMQSLVTEKRKAEEEDYGEGEEDDMELDEGGGGPAAACCSATVSLEILRPPELTAESQATLSQDFPPTRPMPGGPPVDPGASQDDPDATQDDPNPSEATQHFSGQSRCSSEPDEATMDLGSLPEDQREVGQALPAAEEKQRTDEEESAKPAEEEQQPKEPQPAAPAEEEQRPEQAGSAVPAQGEPAAPAQEEQQPEKPQPAVPAQGEPQDAYIDQHSAEDQLQMEDARLDADHQAVNELVQRSNAVAHHEIAQGVSNPMQAEVRNAAADYLASFDTGRWSTLLTCHPNGFHSLTAVPAEPKKAPVEILVGLEIFLGVNPDYDPHCFWNESLHDMNENACRYMKDPKTPGCAKACGCNFFPFVVLCAEVQKNVLRNHDKLNLCLYPSDEASLDHLNTVLTAMPVNKKGKKLLETPHAFWTSCYSFLSRDMATCQKGAEQGPADLRKQVFANHVWPKMFEFSMINNVLEGQHFIPEGVMDKYFLKTIVLGAYVGPHRLNMLRMLLAENPPTRQQCQAAAEGGQQRQKNVALETLMKSINMSQKRRGAEVSETDFWLSKLPEEGTKLLGVTYYNLDAAEHQLLSIKATVSDMQEGATKNLLGYLLEARLREIHDHKTGGSPDRQIYFRDLSEEMGRHALALKVMTANVELRRTVPNFADGACDTVAAMVLTRAPSNCELIARLDMGNSQFQKELNRILDWHSRRVTPPGEADPWAGVSKREAVDAFVAAARTGADRLRQAQQGGVGANFDGGAGPDTEKNKEFVAQCMAQCIRQLSLKDCEQRKTLTDSVELYLGLCHSGATWKFLTGSSGADVFGCTVCYLKSDAEGKEERFRAVLESAHDGLCDAEKAPGAIQAAQAFLASHGGRGGGCKRRRR
jgi:hypothetical protein